MKIAARLAISDGVLSPCQLLANEERTRGVRHNLLPGAKHIHRATVQTSLHGALEESNCSNLLVCRASSGAHGDTRPKHKSQWKPDTGSDLLQDERVRDQCNHIALEVSQPRLSKSQTNEHLPSSEQ